MRARPYREKRRARHDRRVASRLKRKVPAEKLSGSLVLRQPTVLESIRQMSIRQETSLHLLQPIQRRPVQMPIQMPTAVTIQIYSEADLRRLTLIMRKRARKSQTLPLEYRKAA